MPPLVPLSNSKQALGARVAPQVGFFRFVLQTGFCLVRRRIYFMGVPRGAQNKNTLVHLSFWGKVDFGEIYLPTSHFPAFYIGFPAFFEGLPLHFGDPNTNTICLQYLQFETLLWGRLRNCNTSSKILLNKERSLTIAEVFSDGSFLFTELRVGINQLRG